MTDATAPRRPTRGRPTELLEGILTCPTCGATMRVSERGVACVQCGRTYEMSDGIPVILDDLDFAAHDEIEHLVDSDHGHKRSQAAFYDEASAAEFEITRPHGTPALYQWLLADKLRRATRPIAGIIPGSAVLTVCGGSGMDAEFYARLGAHVISADISIGAARRTAERARRFGLPIVSVVADAEHLPFADRSVDVVSVHDGLHHLEDPGRALAEMARVARRAISVTEPADARLTAFAIRLRLARAVEEAGNRVARMQPAVVGDSLRSSGYQIVASNRYLMYYRHVPGRLTRVLSRRPILTVVKAVNRIVDRLVGRFGNKMVVVAVRSEDVRRAERS